MIEIQTTTIIMITMMVLTVPVLPRILEEFKLSRIVKNGEKQDANSKIRRVSIDKFYELVTNDKDAFKKLCLILPTVIKNAVKELEDTEKSNSVFKELQRLSPDLLTSIYLLSFNKYEGFNDFKF